MSDPRQIEVGRLGAAHGVRGWLRVQSFTDPPQRLFEWQRWRLQSGTEVIARLEGIEDRDAAGRLSGQLVLVDRGELPATTAREYYRADLVGFEARNVEDVLLGVVDHFIDTPGNAVMVIRGTREYLVPMSAQHLRSVDQQARRLIVDWPEDF